MKYLEEVILSPISDVADMNEREENFSFHGSLYTDHMEQELLNFQEIQDHTEEGMDHCNSSVKDAVELSKVERNSFVPNSPVSENFDSTSSENSISSSNLPIKRVNVRKSSKSHGFNCSRQKFKKIQ